MGEVRYGDSLRDEPGADAPSPKLGIAALAADTVVYGGTRVLVKSISFLLVPLYAHFLTPAEFGILELILATTALIDVFINLPGVLGRFYFDREDPAWRRQVITLYLGIEAAYPAVLIGALVLFSGTLSDRVIGAEAYAGFFVIALVDLYLTNVVDLPMNLCRIRRKPFRFATYSLVRGLTQIVFSVLLVAVFVMGVKGILIASLVSVCVAFVVTLPEYLGDLTRKVSWGVAREMLSFGWPTIFGGAAFYILNFANRFFIKSFHGLLENGLYGAAFRYSQVVVVGVFAFRMGWTAWHYSWLHTGRHPSMLARGANYYYFGAGLLTVLVSAWILPVFHLLMPAAYRDAVPAVAPLALAAMGSGAYSLYTVGLAVMKRIRLVAPLALTGAAIAIGLYLLLIPPFSFLGAAWGTAAALWIVAGLVYTASQRIYPVPWEWRRVATAVLLTLALVLASLAVDAWVPLGVSLPLRAAITLAFPLGLVALRFFPPDDLAALRRRLRLGRA